MNHKKEFQSRVTKDWQVVIKKKLPLAKFKKYSRTYQYDGAVTSLINNKGSKYTHKYRNSTVEQNYYEHLLSMYLQHMTGGCLSGI